MKRLIRWFVILIVLGALGGAAFGPGASYLKERNRVRFREAEVTRGRIVAVVNSTGTVKPVQTITVGAFVPGPIEKIYVSRNEKVTKDQILARIDPKIYKAKVASDKATLATMRASILKVKANLQLARNKEGRTKALHKESKAFVPAQELDEVRYARESLEADLIVAERSVNQATATLDKSLADLDYTAIRSPVDGMILEQKIEPGQTVASQYQTPELFVVVPDLKKEIHVFASVDEADIGLIDTARRAGQPVRFTVDAWPDDLFEGKVFQIRMNSTTVQNVVTYPVVVSAANPDLKLIPGLTASISFQLQETGDVLRVPNAALRYYPQRDHVRPEDRGVLDARPQANAEADESSSAVRSANDKAELRRNRNHRHVWVVDGDFLRAVPVVVGLNSNQFTEVVSGDLKEGDKLVTGIQPKQP